MPEDRSAAKLTPEQKERIEKAWNKLIGKTAKAKPAIKDKIDLKMPNIKMRISLGKLDKRRTELERDVKKLQSNYLRDWLNLGRAWTEEVRATVKSNIPAHEIGSRKTMLVGKGMELKAAAEAAKQFLEPLANKSITLNNDYRALAKEVQRAAKEQKKAKSKAEWVEINVSGMMIKVKGGDLLNLKGDVSKAQRALGDLETSISKSLTALVQQIRIYDGQIKEIRNFRIK